MESDSTQISKYGSVPIKLQKKESSSLGLVDGSTSYISIGASFQVGQYIHFTLQQWPYVFSDLPKDYVNSSTL